MKTTTHPDFRRSNDQALSAVQTKWLATNAIKAEANCDHVTFRGKSKTVARPGHFFSKGRLTVMPIMATDTNVEIVTDLGTGAENGHKTFDRLRDALRYLAANG